MILIVNPLQRFGNKLATNVNNATARSPILLSSHFVGTYAQAIVACPSTSSGEPAAWYLTSFAGHFFALRGEKMTYRG